MHKEIIEIRKLTIDDIPAIQTMVPVDWKLDIGTLFTEHSGRDYYYPIVAEHHGSIVGTGTAFVNDNATWLGIIVVHDNFRERGIGTLITNHLVDYSKSKGNQTVLLSATDLGFPVYKKIGFKNDVRYLFYKNEGSVKISNDSTHIAAILASDYEKVLELDFKISGEKRPALMINYLKTGYKYVNFTIEGFFLPDFGSGLIVAESVAAGLGLLKFRLSRNSSAICIPESNHAAIEYLESIGYYRFLAVQRMYLNENVAWNSNYIFSRGSGYLG